MKPEDKNDTYYVGLEDATIVRRSLLETAKSAVHTLHAHNRIKEIQDEKLKVRTDLAHAIRSLKDDMHKLQTLLPARDVHVQVQQPQAAPAPMKKRSDHHLDKIEQALNEIEGRLKSL